MNVELPATGCNILSSNSTVYNYSDDRHTRRQYSIYDGKIFLTSTSISSYGYDVTGTCLTTGDLVYKPEYKEFVFPVTAVFVSLLIFWFAYRLMVHKFWRKI